MSCEYCLQTGKNHDFRCPNYEPPKSNYNCSECGENILIGEEYIVNDNGNYAHFECVDYARVLVKFLGYDVKEMEDDNETVEIVAK